MKEFEEGDLVRLRDNHVGYHDNVKQFIGKDCRVIKYTKGGLVHIHVNGDIRKHVSVPSSQLIKQQKDDIWNTMTLETR